MKRVVDQPVRPEKDIDALLNTFFKAEMPREWPAFQPPPRTLPFRPAAPRRSHPWIGSRLALVASVALLMLCGWLLSGTMSGPARMGAGVNIERNDGNATNPRKNLLLPDRLPPDRENRQPGKVNSKIELEQGKDGTSVLIEVNEDRGAPRK